MSTNLAEFSENFRKELIVKNTYGETKEYSSIHSNALADGDEKGKGEFANQVGSLTDVKTRTDNVNKNEYNELKAYGSSHPNALSDGDEWGKGEQGGNIGGKTDIKTRKTSVAKNKYNSNNHKSH